MAMKVSRWSSRRLVLRVFAVSSAQQLARMSLGVTSEEFFYDVGGENNADCFCKVPSKEAVNLADPA